MARNKKNINRMAALKTSKDIDRQIAKENNTLLIWRGRSAIQTSIKRTNRRIEKKKAIKDSSED